MNGSPRRARVEDAMRAELASMIQSEVKDPRVAGTGLVGVTRVELNGDLTVARVYVSIFGQDIDRTLAGLEAAGGFLRGPLVRRLRLRKPPELRFFHDDTAAMTRRLTEIIRDDQMARAVADSDDGSASVGGGGGGGEADGHGGKAQ